MDLKIAVELGIHKAVEYYKQKPEFETEISKFSRLFEKNFGDISERENGIKEQVRILIA